MNNALRWLLHWIGQGLKLWYFSALASFCLIPLYLPLRLLGDGADHFDEIGTLSTIGVVVGYIMCYAVGLAIFTAVLASQLSDHPLRPFKRSRKSESDTPDKTNQAEQDGGGQPATRPESI